MSWREIVNPFWAPFAQMAAKMAYNTLWMTLWMPFRERTGGNHAERLRYDAATYDMGLIVCANRE